MTHILAMCRLTTGKARDKLQALTDSAALDELTIVRHRPVPVSSPNTRVNQVSYAPRFPDSVHDFTVLMRALNIGLMLWTGFWAVWRRKPDAVYGIFLTPYGVYAWFLARLFGKKSIISLIGTDLNDYTLQYAVGKVLLWILKRTDTITVVDEDARQRLVAAGVAAERAVILPNAVDLTPYLIADVAPPKDFDAIYVGLLMDIKGTDMLIETWRYVVEGRAGSRLGIVGDGPLRESMMARAAELGIGDLVTFVGWVDDVPAWMPKGKLYLSLSTQEGVPTALLEAMACGLVPIHTRVGGVPSIITDGVNGYTVDYPTDPEAAAEPIIRLLNDAALFARMQGEALLVRERYALARVTAAWDDILTKDKG